MSSAPRKRDVRRSFDAAAASYDDHAFLQREVSDRLFERLDYIKIEPTHILEIGCGTGYTTEKTRTRFVDSAILALDIAPRMCAVARRRFPQTPLFMRLFKHSQATRFVCADAEALPMADESVDLIVSSLTIQWCDPERVAREAIRVLRPNGLFMFTTFGPDTLKELRNAFKAVDNKPHVNTFVDMHDVGDILSHVGFGDPVMDQEAITLTYSALIPMLRELKGIGAHNVLPGRETGLMSRARWRLLEESYEQFRRDGRLPATYEVVYGHAWKPAFTKQSAKDGEQKIALPEFKRMVKGQ